MKRNVPSAFSGHDEGVSFAERTQKQRRPAGRTIYFGSVNGNVYLYTPFEEREEIEHTLWPTCVIEYNKILYVGDGYGSISSRNLSTGRRISELPLCRGSRITDVVELGGILYFNSYYSHEGKIYSYAPQNGEVNTIVKTDKPVLCMAKHDGLLYFGNNKGEIHSYNTSTDETHKVAKIKKWRGSLQCQNTHHKLRKAEKEITHIIKYGKMLYFTSNCPVPFENALYSYNPKTKRVNKIEKNIVVNCMAVLDEDLYIGGADGKISHYNHYTGKCKTAINAPSTVFHMAAADGLLYFDYADGRIYSYDPKNDELQQVTSAGTSISCMTAAGGMANQSQAD